MIDRTVLDAASICLRSSWRQAIRFVIPVECQTCGAWLGSDPVPFFCRICWGQIIPFTSPACARCHQPFISASATSHSPQHECQDCLERPPAFERAWTPYPYLPPLRDAICAFKYRGKYALAEPLARLMINVLPSHLIADFIIPVPLHPTRLRSREYNQSLLLADQIGRHLRIAVWPNSLVRVLHTDPQTTLSRHDRLRNLRKAFSILNPERLVGKRILLVDDVYTTGTTLHECAKELMNSGANSVVALTLARTVDRDLVPDRILAEQGERTLPVLGF